MNERQYHALELRGTDVEGAIRRVCGSEEIYTMCLREFLSDNTVAQLITSVENAAWDDAFTAAHALKGLAGNMGFVPLMHNTGQLIVVIRRGKISEIPKALELVSSAYRDIIDAIQRYFVYTDENEKEK